MLTINKPAHHGYRSAHDLPTPPNTSRLSPPLTTREPRQTAPHLIPHESSILSQLMSAPHRGLPPPAAMALAQPPPLPPPAGSGPPQSGGGPPLSQAPPMTPGVSSYGQFPPPPSWQHVSEESMRTYLVAKTEEEKRKQEEEKTRQESYRLEQRRTEHEIIQTSLRGGIPPAMVPIVFAGMGGGVLPQAALEWAQQYLYPHSQQSQPPALLAAGPSSPEHHRHDSQPQAYSHYGSGGVPSTPGSGQQPPSAYQSHFPASPTRPRGHSVPGRPAGGPGVPSLTNAPSGSERGSAGSVGAAAAAGVLPNAPTSSSQQQEQPSSIYFHHWQPPTSQAGGGRDNSSQPTAPLAGDSPRKRKATGPQLAAPAPGMGQRAFRSPPPFLSTGGLSSPAPGRRRGHARQRSDMGPSQRSAGGRGGSAYSSRGGSPTHSGPPSAREAEPASSSSAQQQHRSGTHSVSSLLTDNPPTQSSFQTFSAADERSRRGSGEHRQTRAGVAGGAAQAAAAAAAAAAAKRERDNE